MRIISGSLGGRRLKTVEGEGYRPAMARTRESLFSMLGSRGLVWSEARVLDLFAGSGSLAFEALSRGAAQAVLVENAAPALRCLQENIARLGLEGRARLLKEDVLRYLRRGQVEAFDLVFMDPPYRKNMAGPAFKALAARSWLRPQAFVCAEIEKNLQLDVPEPFELLTERLFGQTRICIWTLA